MDKMINPPEKVNHSVTHIQNNPTVSSLHHCTEKEKITRLEEKVKTLFVEHNKLNDTLTAINHTQTQLLTQITNLTSIINTLKWTLTLMIAIFGGLFVFILSEVIKIIH